MMKEKLQRIHRELALAAKERSNLQSMMQSEHHALTRRLDHIEATLERIEDALDRLEESRE